MSRRPPRTAWPSLVQRGVLIFRRTRPKIPACDRGIRPPFFRPSFSDLMNRRLRPPPSPLKNGKWHDECPRPPAFRHAHRQPPSAPGGLAEPVPTKRHFGPFIFNLPSPVFAHWLPVMTKTIPISPQKPLIHPPLPDFAGLASHSPRIARVLKTIEFQQWANGGMRGWNLDQSPLAHRRATPQTLNSHPAAANSCLKMAHACYKPGILDFLTQAKWGTPRHPITSRRKKAPKPQASCRQVTRALLALTRIRMFRPPHRPSRTSVRPLRGPVPSASLRPKTVHHSLLGSPAHPEPLHGLDFGL